MKTTIQAFICSVIIHLLYIFGTMTVGYIRTKYYKVDEPSEWESINYLQSEIAFGIAFSPLFYIVSLVGVTIVCGIIILLYKKFN
ncbi:hypothetical protein [Aquibacillus rhizosphaerae]|uniref:Menaquinol-cytochrome c reductase cytochrome b subunit n=1 Tax=Aquibacillus rhizosphaerae TaxID=3051431 RepID=A0ABT7LBK4_9BACI|nr:hypothetical protein [Aquibacillus sp. LR5S19]MDL4843236.1 hypothetical protein [Aquibacillus sp. LR5S19]